MLTLLQKLRTLHSALRKLLTLQKLLTLLQKLLTLTFFAYPALCPPQITYPASVSLLCVHPNMNSRLQLEIQSVHSAKMPLPGAKVALRTTYYRPIRNFHTSQKMRAIPDTFLVLGGANKSRALGCRKVVRNCNLRFLPAFLCLGAETFFLFSRKKRWSSGMTCHFFPHPLKKKTKIGCYHPQSDACCTVF